MSNRPASLDTTANPQQAPARDGIRSFILTNGHLAIVYADYAIWDTVSGTYVNECQNNVIQWI